MHKLICFLLVLLLFFSCKCTTGPEVSLKMSTDKDGYKVGEMVIVYIENERISPAYFYHCNYEIGFYVEQKENFVWKQAYSHAIICLAIYVGGILELAPGEKDTIEITLPKSGVYRLAAPYGLEQTERNLTELLYSNEFIVQ